MLRALLVLTLLALPLVPTSSAAIGVDGVLTLRPGEAPTYSGPPDVLTFQNQTPGEWAQWRVATMREYTTLEVRIVKAFDVTRPRQAVPLLFPDASDAMCHDPRAKDYCAFPLFEAFPNDQVWNVDTPARVFFTNGTADDIILRLGIPGPFNGTLAIERDVTPPAFVLAPPANVTSVGFIGSSTTDELALGDLQVRAVGAATEWVRNPTAIYHYKQIFPIQGLAPDTDHEARVVFTDWAGNEATSATFHVRTASAPQVPLPVVTPVAPPPNATLANGTDVLVRATFTSPGSTVDPSDVRLFFDKAAVTTGLVVRDGAVAFVPPAPLAPGKHSVSVEVTDAAGATGIARWSFTVAGARSVPLEGAALPVLATLAGAAALAARRR